MPHLGRWGAVVLVALLQISRLSAPAAPEEQPRAAEDLRIWHVRSGSNGDGTATAPFGSIAGALAAAGPGDTVLLAPGTYAEVMRTTRGGTSSLPLTIRGMDPLRRPVITAAGRVATIDHPYVIVEDIEFDGQFGTDDAVRVATAATGLVLRRVEIRRSSRDCVDMAAPANVTITRALIHHCLNAADGRTDAHGIVAGNVRNLTIRGTEVHTFSGDAIQLDPGREQPAWSNVRVEGCRLWLAPLPTAMNGFAAGVVPGENAIDTKTPRSGRRATLTVVDTEARGFKDGLIANMAAFNIKERVDAHFDRVTVSDSTHAFRLRGARDFGAHVTMSNIVVHSVANAFRYEDDIEVVQLRHVTLGRNVRRAFERVDAPMTRVEVGNLLVLGPELPGEARGNGMRVDATAFVDVSADDYRLTASSPAIDRATPTEVLLDRAGVRRPQGARADVGAFEFCAVACPP